MAAGQNSMEELSEESLKKALDADELSLVTAAELRLDTVLQGADCLGVLLPNLLHLKLTGSTIASLRDLGTGLAKLQVLWLGRCKLQDLSGLASLSELQELYLPFNDVADLSPLTLHDSIEVLDLEGNAVADVDEVASLWMCSRLKELTLAGNPICKANAFSRSTVLELLPQLRVLDDLAVEEVPEAREVAIQDERLSDSLEVEVLFTHPLLVAALQARGDAPWVSMESVPDEESLVYEVIKAASLGPSLRPERFAFGACERHLLRAREEASSDLTCGSLLAGSPLKAARLRRRREEPQVTGTAPAEGRPLGQLGIRELLRQHWDAEAPQSIDETTEETSDAKEEKQLESQTLCPKRPSTSKIPGQGRPFRKSSKLCLDEVPEAIVLQRSSSAGAEVPSSLHASRPCTASSKRTLQQRSWKAASRPPTSAARTSRCSSRASSRTFCLEPLRNQGLSKPAEVSGLPPVSVCFQGGLQDGPFGARYTPAVEPEKGITSGVEAFKNELRKLSFDKACLQRLDLSHAKGAMRFCTDDPHLVEASDV